MILCHPLYLIIQVLTWKLCPNPEHLQQHRKLFCFGSLLNLTPHLRGFFIYNGEINLPDR